MKLIMSVMKRTRRVNFFFKRGKLRNIGKIYIRNTHTNVFLTFTDMRNKVVKCGSAGSSGVLGSRRRKKAPQTIESIIKYLKPKMNINKIKYAEVVLKSRVDPSVYYLGKSLRMYGVRPRFVRERVTRPHNGTRARKLRRT